MTRVRQDCLQDDDVVHKPGGRWFAYRPDHDEVR